MEVIYIKHIHTYQATRGFAITLLPVVLPWSQQSSFRLSNTYVLNFKVI